MNASIHHAIPHTKKRCNQALRDPIHGRLRFECMESDGEKRQKGILGELNVLLKQKSIDDGCDLYKFAFERESGF